MPKMLDSAGLIFFFIS